jgi:hypothetical protein
MVVLVQKVILWILKMIQKIKVSVKKFFFKNINDILSCGEIECPYCGCIMIKDEDAKERLKIYGSAKIRCERCYGIFFIERR